MKTDKPTNTTRGVYCELRTVDKNPFVRKHTRIRWMTIGQALAVLLEADKKLGDKAEKLLKKLG